MLESILSLGFGGGETEDSFTDVLVVIAGLSVFFREDFAGDAVLLFVCEDSCLLYVHAHTT